MTRETVKEGVAVILEIERKNELLEKINKLLFEDLEENNEGWTRIKFFDKSGRDYFFSISEIRKLKAKLEAL